MEKLKNITLKDCQQKCSNTKGCKGIEYFRASDPEADSGGYEENDCNLSSSLDPAGCTAERWQMWLWIKGAKIGCKEWKNQHFRNVIGTVEANSDRVNDSIDS